MVGTAAAATEVAVMAVMVVATGMVVITGAMVGMMVVAMGVATGVVTTVAVTTAVAGMVMATAVVVASTAPDVTGTYWTAVVRVPAVRIPMRATQISIVIGHSGQESVKPAMWLAEHGMRAGTLPGTRLTPGDAQGIRALATRAEPRQRKQTPTGLTP